MEAGELENGNAFSKEKIGAARKRGFKAQIRDLCGYYFVSCRTKGGVQEVFIAKVNTTEEIKPISIKGL